VAISSATLLGASTACPPELIILSELAARGGHMVTSCGCNIYLSLPLTPLPFLYFSQFPTQNLNSEAAPCSLPTPPLQHTHTHTHTHTTHNFIPLRNHTLFLYQLIQGHIATEYSIPGTERLQLSPPYPKAPLTSTSLALLSFHHASLPPKLTTLPLP